MQATPDTMIGRRWYCSNDVKVVVLVDLKCPDPLVGDRLSLSIPAQCMKNRLLHLSGVSRPCVLDDPKGNPRETHQYSQA